MKFLLWMAVGFVIVMWMMRTNKTRPQAGAHFASRRAGEAESGESMVRCAHCGTYIPVSEALVTQPNKAYCSEEHRLQHAAN